MMEVKADACSKEKTKKIDLSKMKKNFSEACFTCCLARWKTASIRQNRANGRGSTSRLGTLLRRETETEQRMVKEGDSFSLRTAKEVALKRDANLEKKKT